MKNKHWAVLLASILFVSLTAGLLLVDRTPASRVQITSDGTLVATVNLAQEQEFTVESPNGGFNTVTVKDGAIAVTAASCPDHYCMDRGFCNSGTQIVCLPNRLVIQFLDEETIDGLVG